MKNKRVNDRGARLLAMSLALSATVGLLGGTPLATAAISDTGDNNRGSLVEKMRSWQDKMSDAFRDTWKGLWTDKDAKSLNQTSVATASLDLREQHGSYIVRLNLPNRDLNKVDVKLEGNILRITAPADGSAAQYRQDVVLDDIASNAQPQIERKQQDSMIVVTVPKQSVANKGPSSIPIAPFAGSLGAWDRDVLARMEQMQREMDRIFAEAFEEFQDEPDSKGVFDRPQFGSSLDLQEDGNTYVVRAYLPHRDMNNINVTSDGRTLRIDAKAESSEKKENEGAYFASKSQYSQVLTLPGPVDTSKMTVDRKEDMLVVTLPKAASS